MKVVINGYGRMGREIEEILLDRGDTVAARIDINGRGDYTELTTEILKELNPDALIEFATEDCVVKHAEICCEAGVPVVVGTTGWGDRIDKVKEIVSKLGGTYLYGSNFSIGAHMFFALAEKAASMINPLPEYDIFMTEFHHNKKVDSPSGTALTTASKIIQNNVRKKEIVIDPLQRKIEEHELHVASIRGGSIPGTHSVFMDSLADTIEITHRARSRKGFALGSILAAKWLIGKKGFFSVEDYISDLLNK